MKKAICLLAIMVIVLSITYADTSFTDVNNEDWFKSDLDYCVNNSLVNGYSDGSFKPGREISKAEFITVVIASVFEKESNGRTQWYSKSYNKALKHDLIDVEFYQSDANASISREEMAVVISKVLEISDVILDESKIKEDIKDYDEIKKENQIAVMNTYKSSIISGFPDGTFRPDETLKRSQLSKVTALMHKLDRKAFNMPAFAEVIDSVEKDTVYEKVSDTVEIVEGITFDQKLLGDNWNDWDEYSESMRALELLAIESVKINQDEKTISFYVPHVAEGLFWEFDVRAEISDKLNGEFENIKLDNIDFNNIHGKIIKIFYDNSLKVPLSEIVEMVFYADIVSEEISQTSINNKRYQLYRTVDFK